MAYNEELAQRIGEVLGERDDIQQKKMFGGVAFMASGHMCCGLVGDVLMVRVGRDNEEKALGEPHVRPMDFTGKPMRGYIYVDPEGTATAKGLARWVLMGVRFVDTLPPKKPK